MASLGMKKFIAIAGLLLLAATPSLAKKHPVPLDEKTDAAKCLEGHEAKSKGKAVHRAMARGCRSCHEVRVNRDITRIKLITTTATALCLSCHADKNAADSKGRV